MNRAPALMPRSRQRGAVLLFAAMGISALIVTASLIDLGLLYQYRREYQKTADLAAMAGAAQLFNGCAAATAAATTSVSRNLGGRNHQAPTITCGRWSPSPTPMFDDTPTGDPRAMRVTVNGAPPGLLPFIPNRVIGATATAIADQPIAALTLRSSLLTVDTAQSAVLNSVVGGLLGGAVNLSAGSWQGLLNTDVNLLSYMEALAVNLGLDALDHEGVLASSVTAGDLVNTAIDVLQDGGGTGDVGAGLAGLQSLALAIPGISPAIALADLLAVEAGAQAYALDTTLNLLQLVQASAQLSGGDAVVDVDLPVSIPGVASVSTKLQAGQTGVPVAVGNPEWASAAPLGPDGIIVSSGNLRALVSLELPVVGSTLSNLQSLLTSNALIGISGAVNSLLTLDLVGLVNSLLCALYCDNQGNVIDVRVLQVPRVDVAIDAGSGRANVTAHECDGEKSLSVDTLAAVADVRIGQFSGSEAEIEAAVFSGGAIPDVEPLPLLDIGHYRARYRCALLIVCGTTWLDAGGNWVSSKSAAFRHSFSGGGIGIRLGDGDSGAIVAGTSSNLTYADPPADGLPELGEPPAWQTVSASDLVGSLSGTLSGLEVVYFEPSNGNVLGGVLALTGAAVDPLVSALEAVILGALSPLVDPLVNDLLGTLGANLAEAEVGANLTCNAGGATLVR